MESLVHEPLQNHAIRYHLIYPAEHGFVLQKSRITNLFKCQYFVSGALARGVSVNVLYIDFSKAFENVPHNKLVLILRAYGFDNRYCRWIDSFL